MLAHCIAFNFRFYEWQNQNKQQARADFVIITAILDSYSRWRRGKTKRIVTAVITYYVKFLKELYTGIHNT